MPAMTTFLLSFWFCSLLPTHCRFTELLLRLFTLNSTHTHTHTHTHTLSRTHLDEDRPLARNSTWQNTTFTGDRHPCPQAGLEPAISASGAAADRRLRQSGQREARISALQNSTSQNYSNSPQKPEEARSLPQVNADHETQRCPNGNFMTSVQHGPRTSTRRISWATGVAQTWVWIILYHGDCYPYHLPVVQHLLPGGHANHVQFVQTWLQILPEIPWTGGAQSSTNGITKIKNSLSWTQ